MSNTAAQDHDPESLHTVLIDTDKPPRHRWKQAIFALRAQPVLFNSISNPTDNHGQKRSPPPSRVSSSSSYNALNTRDAEEIAEIPPDVSLQIVSDGSENRNCSSDQQLLLDTIARMVKKKDLESLNAFGGVRGVEVALSTRSGNEPNTFYNPQSPEQSFFHFLYKACNNPSIVLLVSCAALSFGFGIKEEGPKDGWYDGVTALVAVLTLVLVTTGGKYWRAMKLKKKSSEEKIICKIFEGDIEKKISISDIRVGNVVCLTKGDLVPADGLFVDGESLILDDMPGSTINDQNPFVSSGTEVINGHGRMLATSVGEKTAWSETMSQVTRHPYEKTHLQARLDKVNNRIQIVALLTSIFNLVVLFVRYKFGKTDDENGRPEIRGNPTAIGEFILAMERIFIRPAGPISTLTTSLAVCLVGLQEGLPFVVTLSVVYWNEKAASNKAKVQEFLACVNMGSVTTICMETLGGPMLNHMVVDMFRIGKEIITEETVVDPAVREALCHGIGTLVMVPRTSHSSIEDSILRWAWSKFDKEMENFEQHYTIVETKRLNSDKEGCCALTKKNGDNGENFHLHWKGHAATILAMCSQYYDTKGAIKSIDEQSNMVFEQMIKDMRAKSFKTIALAHKQINVEALEEDNLILIGLLGLKKKHLEETTQSMKAFTDAGVNIKLVTSESVTILEVIINECGMLMRNPDRMKLEGEKFRNFTKEDRKEMVDRITMMENALPSDTALLVRCLRENGHAVAMVGLRTKEIPALKEADVGLTMGTQSSKMAKECAGIIWDGSFNLLVTIIRCGRCVYHNIQKFIQLELTMILAGLLIISITTTSLGDAPITAFQLIWVNLIVTILGGLALLTEPPSGNSMGKPPVSRTKPIITKAMWRNIVTQVLYQAAILVTFQFKGQAILGINGMVNKTMIFNSFILCQVFNQFNAREPEKKNVFKGIHQSCWFWVAVGTAGALQVILIKIAGYISITGRLNWVQWAICFLIGMVSCVIDWAGKCTSSFITDCIITPLRSYIDSIRVARSTPLESASILELPLMNGGSSKIPS